MLNEITKLVLMLFGFVIAIGCGRSNSELQNIFGEDGRKTVVNREHPFTSIGKLNNACSGVMISKKHMLTAAHCVFDSKSQRPDDSFTRFDLGLLNGQSTAKASPVRAWIGSVTPEELRRTDWAIVELNAPIGEMIQIMPLADVEIEKTLPYAVNLTGYHADINGGLTPGVEWGCSVRAVEGGRLFHDCDSTPGISGGPLFVSIDNQWKILGISVSEFRNGEEPPVKREAWTPEFTNVAVPARSFFNVASKILSSMDKGITPEISDVILIDFKSNSVPSPVPIDVSPSQNPEPTPPVSPNQVPAPLQKPGPQFSPDAVFSIQRMLDVGIIWQNISTVIDLHKLLEGESYALSNAAVSTQNHYLLANVEYFALKLHESMSYWNALSHCKIVSGLCAMDRNRIYNSYVGLKHAEIDMRHLTMSLPSANRDFFNLRANLTLDYMRRLELAIFSDGSI